MPIVVIPQHVEQQTADSLFVIGVFTDNATFKQQFDTTFVGPTTAEQARQRLASLLTSTQSQDELKKVLQVGVPFNLTAPVVDPPPDPTPEEEAAALAKAEWVAAANRLVRLKQFLSPDHAEVVAAQSIVDGAFLKGYV